MILACQWIHHAASINNLTSSLRGGSDLNSLRRFVLLYVLFALLAAPLATLAQQTDKKEESKKEEPKQPPDKMSSATFNGLRMRCIGPALISGRVVGFAVNPQDKSNYFVAEASGGVWRTTNAGITWT